MSYCPKCGSEVTESMIFCPKCGASLKAGEQADWRQQWRAQRRQWREQRREARQYRLEEKYENREYTFIGPLVGGLILVALGFSFYLAVTSSLNWQAAQAIFLILVGLIVLVGAIYAYSMKRRIVEMRKTT